MLLSKDVLAVERDFVSVLDHSPGTKTDKKEYFSVRGIRVPKTNYDSMWVVLTERLHRSGAASAVFEYLRGHMPQRLKELLQRSRRGRPLSLRRNEPAIVWDFFFRNANLRRIGQLFLEDLNSRGGRLQKSANIRKVVKSTKRYEIALSFAGENRPFVDQVARELRAMGVTVFYDAFEEVNLFGKDLAAHFAGIYKDLADYCAMFISNHYVHKAWPQLERQHAQARALVERREYILPIRLDDAEVPGLSPTIGYVDARSKTSQAIAIILFRKIRRN
ncbi:MAG: TIR domain-containing protein [Acidobacteriota bacterium]